MVSIPIVQLDIPEYAVPKPAKLSGKIHHTQWDTTIPLEYAEMKPKVMDTFSNIPIESQRRSKGS